MGDGFTFFVVYGRVSTLVDTDKVQVVERDFPLLSAKEVNAVIKRRLRRRLNVVGCVHRHRRAHGRHRRDPQPQGHRGGEGPGVLPGAVGDQPGAQVSVPELVETARGRRPTRCWCRRWSPSATRTCRTPGDVGGVPGGAAGGQAAAVIVGGPRLRRADGRRLGVDRIFGRGTTPREVASTLVTPGGERLVITCDAPPVRAVRARPLRGNWSTARTRWACSATSPPRCASAGRRRGAVRVVLRRAVQGAGAGGDVLEVSGTVTRMGTRSRTIDFTATGWCAGAPRAPRPPCSPNRSWR
jgi:beta-lysine 5,6-aminomutase beta subunit